jgi:hypothetical protein
VESGKSNVANVGVRTGAAGIGAYLTATLGPEAGAATAETLAQAGERLVGWLESRSRDRVARTLLGVREQLEDRVRKGATVQADLYDWQDEKSMALFELVVEAAARSAEDKKCEVIRNTYVSIAVDPAISTDDALLYVQRIRDSSWRQLVILQGLLTGNVGSTEITSPALAAEVTQLAETLGLIGIGQPGGGASPPSATWGGDGGLSLGEWTGTKLGRELARLGNLKETVPSSDLDALAETLLR